LKPNDWGFFDTHGNVSNGCQDRYLDDSKGTRKPLDVEDSVLTIDATMRVVRGGSFEDPPWRVGCAYRNHKSPADQEINVGFRVARSIVP
jgi:formylglycine-generating enzyme required for sulfatase activity